MEEKINESVHFCRGISLFRRQLLVLLAAMGLSPSSHGATFPSRFFTLYVPFSAGGIVDSNARVIAEKLGAGLAMNDLMAGTVDVMFDYPVTSLPLIEPGKLRALVVTGTKRLANLPDVPTIAQVGFPDTQSSVWSGLFAPKGVPQEAVDVLSQACTRALEDPAVKSRALQNGNEILTHLNAATFPKFVAAESLRWQRIVQAAGVQL